MRKLPQELLERIVFYADHDTHINLLTVSQTFQVAVERTRYPRCARLRSGQNLDEILLRYRGHRVHFLCEVEFTVTFPELKHTAEQPLACRETREDLDTYDQQFSSQISALFTALKAHEDRTTAPENQPPSIALRIKMAPKLDDGNKPCHHRRYTSWRLHLHNPTHLPSLSLVHTLHLEAKDTTHRPDDSAIRPIDLSAIHALVLACPALSELHLPHLYERDQPNHLSPARNAYAHAWQGPRRDARHALARAVAAAPPPPALRKATLHFAAIQQYGPSGSRQDAPQPDLAHPHAFDPLSAALRAFSRNLVELDLRVRGDAALFWPAAGEEEEEEAAPAWPRLRALRVELHPALADGSWLFCGPRGEGAGGAGFVVGAEHYPPLGPSAADAEVDAAFAEEGGLPSEEGEPCCFRVVPVRERVEGVLGAFARAVARMPVVARAEVCAWLAWAPGEEMAEEYDEDEESLHRWGVEYKRGESGNGMVEWQVGNWRPSEELLELFGSVNGDGEVEIVWKDFKHVHMRTLDGETVC